MEFDIKTGKSRLRISRENNYAGRPVIIFLHESLGCIELWKDFPKKLGEVCRCNILIYDRLGYGKSDPFSTLNRNKDYMETEADILHKILEICKIDKAILFGHSDGGTIALIAASKYPDKISGVITEGAHVFVEEKTLEGIRKAVDSYKTTDMKDKLFKYHGDKTDAVFRAWTDTWLSVDFRNWNIETFLPGIKCPCLIIHGDNDMYGSNKQVESIINGVSGITEKLIIPGAGHSPHKESRDLTLSRSKEFIETLLLDTIQLNNY